MKTRATLGTTLLFAAVALLRGQPKITNPLDGVTPDALKAADPKNTTAVQDVRSRLNQR